MAAVRMLGANHQLDGLATWVGFTRTVAALILLALWYGCSVSGWFFRDVISTPWSVAVAVFQTLATPQFYTSLLVTVEELLVGILTGGTAALVVGTVLGRSDFAARAYEPWVHYLGPTPKIVLFPVVLLLCGAGPESKMALGALSCFFPLALAIAAAVRLVNPVFLRVGRSLGLSRWQTVVHVYVPAIKPALLNALRIAFAVTAVGVLLAETKISEQGLGFLVVESYQQFDMPRMYALLILAVCLVAGINNILQRISNNERRER